MAETKSAEADPKPSRLLILAPLALYSLHALVFRHWIADDAGISFAYARSLAHGHGLVAQPGSPPVEGYSNFAWVVLLAPFFRLGLFDPFVTPKLVSLAVVAATFRVLSGPVWLLTQGSRWTVVLVLCLIAVNSPFVIWTTSGLENSLYSLVIALLFAGSLEGGLPERQNDSVWRPAGLGLIAALVAMTRPDGLLYVPAYPALLMWTAWTAGLARRPMQQAIRPDRGTPASSTRAGVYLAAFGLTFGLFVGFRLWYFHDLFPNTYYSKGFAGAGVGPWLQLHRITENLWSLRSCFLYFSDSVRLQRAVSVLIIAALAVATSWASFLGRLPRGMATVAVFVAASTADYVLMPSDWMGEYRFATPAILFWYLFAGVMAHVWLAQFQDTADKRPWKISVALLAGLLVYDVSIFTERSIRFAENPTLPFDIVGDLFGHRFNGYSESLGVTDGSLLAPDMGGTLYYSRLRIYDLGRLCDRTIARTLRKNQPEFYRYVFEDAKPTFIHTHGSWTALARFHDDVRFRRDYVPLYEYIDPRAGGLFSGDYVRRDAVVMKASALAELRTRLRAPIDPGIAAARCRLGFSQWCDDAQPHAVSEQ